MDLVAESVREAASWRLASTLARRHPAFRIIRAFYGGGMYDVLELNTGSGCLIALNRNGTVQVIQREDGLPTDHLRPMDWTEVLTRDFPDTVEKLMASAGLPRVATPPPSTSHVLVYRVLSALTSLRLLAEPIWVEMGAGEDEYNEEQSGWLANYPAIEANLPRSGSGVTDRHFEYWHAGFPGFSAAFETETGNMWTRKSTDPVNLSTVYAQQKRSMSRLIAHTLQLGST